MMTEYDYFISGFLASDSDILRQLIVAQALLAPTLVDLSITGDTVEGVDGCDINAIFSAPLSGAAQTLLAGLMATYMTSVPVAKIKKLAELKTTVQDYVEAHYDSLTRQQLLGLYTLAKFDGRTLRAAYIKPGLDWINSILSYAASSAVAIQAILTKSAVDAYSIDVAGNVSADPLLTVGAAVLIVL